MVFKNLITCNAPEQSGAFFMNNTGGEGMFYGIMGERQ